MARADFGIALGSGGEILEVPENEELLEEIRKTPVLPPADLLKLGAYFRGYETNEPLGNHLALIGLLALVNDPEAQKNLQEVLVRTAAVAGRTIGTSADAWDAEDYLDFDCDDWNREGGGCLPFIRRVPLPGINLGLLIETPHPKSRRRSRHKNRYFIIGIAPDPVGLQPAKRTVQS